MAPGEEREGMEINGVAQPGPGLLAEGAAFDPAPDHPIEGRPRAEGDGMDETNPPVRSTDHLAL